MTKRMLIDATQPEETRVVIVDGNKVEDVEYESSSRKQIKGNIYLAKVIRIEPSLQAAFIDYGGNRHGFLAFNEIHPDYYNVSEEVLQQVDAEVEEIIENKIKYLKEREENRARHKAEKEALEAKRRLEAEQAAEIEDSMLEPLPNDVLNEEYLSNEEMSLNDESSEEEGTDTEVNSSKESVETVEEEEIAVEEEIKPESETENKPKKHRRTTRRPRDRKKTTKTLADSTGLQDEMLQDDSNGEDFDDDDDDDIESSDDTNEYNFDVQRRLIRARKLYHNCTIQDVIREGQVLLIQVVKEERGNKGAACTTYISLAGRYCVLMPNRIKSGGVSRKIGNANDRRRLKGIMKNLPMSPDMSLIIRTAGEDKTKAEIVRDYNYLIRTWNAIRYGALKNPAPAMIYEEGNLIKRALRDMYTKDIDEVIIDGNEAYRTARNFVKILSPHSLKQIRCRRQGDAPVFQRFQVEAQLDRLHDPIVQLESGGYLVINPTEALVSIDVNSGRATKEKDIEETALKTNLEAADEIAKQLKMRDLAGLIVVDFIDMYEPQNNIAVEKRMKEAMKDDRARIQIAKMSIFGLLEISRQRMHSSFIESNYETCPYCNGRGVTRTIESGATLILRALEGECVRNRKFKFTTNVPADLAVYLLNQKRKQLADLEENYQAQIIIAADTSMKDASEFKIYRERVKQAKDCADSATSCYDSENVDDDLSEEEEYTADEVTTSVNETEKEGTDKRFRFRRNGRNRRNNRNMRNNYERRVKVEEPAPTEELKPEKKSWWKKLIG